MEAQKYSHTKLIVLDYRTEINEIQTGNLLLLLLVNYIPVYTYPLTMSSYTTRTMTSVATAKADAFQ